MSAARFGLIAMLAWCFISAAADVYVGKLVATIDPTLLCFGIFSCSVIFFIVLNLKNRLILYTKISTHFKTILMINITTFLAWYFTIYPLKYIEPSIVVAVILATLPIATLISSIALNSDNAVATLRNFIISILLFFGIGFLAVVVFSHHSAIKHTPLWPTIGSFLGCMTSGFALGINNIHTKQLSRAGFTPIDILSTRFILTVLISGLLIRHQIYSVVHHDVWLYIIIAALAIIIIPQIIFQYALRAIEPLTTSIIGSFKAVVVFGMEILNQQLILTAWTIMGVIYLTCVAISGTLLQNRKNIVSQKQQTTHH